MALWIITCVLWMAFLFQVRGQQCTCEGGCDTSHLIFPGSDGRIVDVAYGKAASMKSGFSGTQGQSGPACMAVNGKTDTEYRTLNQSNPNCVHTAPDDIAAWWEVDLGRSYTVTNITIYNRENSSRRMSGIHVEVDNQTCHTFPLEADDTPALDALPDKIEVTCVRPLTGRVVRLQKRGQGVNNRTGSHVINVCEVQVWGCSAYYYGYDCSGQCGQCADNATCNTETGVCPHGCQPGWQGEKCDQVCDKGRYGSNCNSTCGQCSDGDSCHVTSGICPNGCAAGHHPWDPRCKTLCPHGRYGKNCMERCGACLGGANCNPVNGTCQACQEHFRQPLCKLCTGKRYGADCLQNCSVNCGGDGSCDKDFGRCVDQCVAGYRPGNSGFCIEKCPPGTFGMGCARQCGFCANFSKCRHDTGVCEKGCTEGVEGSLCMTVASVGDNSKLAWPIVGAVFGGIFFIAVGIAVGLTWFRRSRAQNPSEPEIYLSESASESVPPEVAAASGPEVTSREEDMSADVTEYARNDYDAYLQTPDDSDKVPYSTPVFAKGMQYSAPCSHFDTIPDEHATDSEANYCNL